MKKKSHCLENQTHVNLHLLVQAIVHDQTVGHPYTMRLHRMTRNVGIVSHVRIIKVGNLAVAIIDPVGVNGVQRRCYARHPRKHFAPTTRTILGLYRIKQQGLDTEQIELHVNSIESLPVITHKNFAVYTVVGRKWEGESGSFITGARTTRRDRNTRGGGRWENSEGKGRAEE